MTAQVPPRFAAVPLADLLANPRGVAFAAFGSPAQIGAILGLGPHDVEAFQAAAHSHFLGMMGEAQRARAAAK